MPELNAVGITPQMVTGVMWSLVGLAIIFTAVRTWIRFHVSRRLSVDDGFVFFALACLIIMAILYALITDIIFEIVAIIDGRAKPSPGFMERGSFFLRCQFAIILLFWTTLWAVKGAFLMYYKNLFKGLQSYLLKIWWAVTIFTILTYLGCWATQLASCEPISSYFTLGACETQRDIYVSNLSLYYASAVDILCDLLIMALPLRLLWGLRVSRMQKAALGGIFGLGAIIIVFAIIRVIYTKATSRHVDPTWLALWSMVEASIAVIVACLPTFRTFFSKHSASSYKNTPFSTNPNSNNSRTRKSAIRLEELKLDREATRDKAQYSQPSTPYSMERQDKTEGRTGYTAGAEGLDSLTLGAPNRSAGESQEDILPKMPENGVLVRKDIYMTSEAV